MSTDDSNWQDRLGLQKNEALPRLSDEFDGDTPRRGRRLPPPASRPADREETPTPPTARTFAERLRARREEAERAGEATGDDPREDLYLSPSADEANGQRSAVPPPSMPMPGAERRADPEGTNPVSPPSPGAHESAGTESPLPAPGPGVDAEPGSVSPSPPPPSPEARPAPPSDSRTPGVYAHGIRPPRPGYPSYPGISARGGRHDQDDDLYDDGRDQRDVHADVLDTMDDEYHDAIRRPEPGRPMIDDYDDAYYDDYAEEHRRRRRGPLMLFAGLAGVGVIAAGLIFAYQGQSTDTGGTEPPRVAAPAEEPKTRPQVQPPAEGAEQTKLFYDRIVGDQTVEGERIQSREERPLDPGSSVEPQPLQPLTPDQLGGDELPVPLPPPLPDGTSGSLNPEGGGQETSDAARTATESGQDTVSLSPVPPPDSEPAQSAERAVPPLPGSNTLPDGSNVSASPTAGAPDSASSTPPADPDVPRPRAKPQGVIEAARRTRVASITPVTAAPTEPLSIAPLPGSGPGTETATPADAAPASIQPLPQPVAPATPVTGQSDTSSGDAPQQDASLRPAAPQPGIAEGAYVVQLASYKDEASALTGFQDLRVRHPFLLGRFQPLISKTTVGTFGTFYRLQVGPIVDQQSGSQLCVSLLAAGEKDCLVKRR